MGKVAVLGLGPSVSLFQPDDFDLTIGVNDIWRIFPTDIIVCVDYEQAFKPDRLKIIRNSKPQIFYSQIVSWDYRQDFRKIDLLPGYPDNFVTLDAQGFHKSYCSPFIAVQIAYKYHQATEIHLFGVDFINHWALKGRLLDSIKKHFVNLRKALTERGCEMIIHGEGILTA